MSDQADSKGWQPDSDGGFSLGSTAGLKLAGLTACAGLWNAFCVLVIAVGWRQFVHDWRPEMWFVLFFPAIGLMLLVSWVRVLIQWRRFGRSRLRTRRCPAVGSYFEAAVCVPTSLEVEGDARILLECSRTEYRRTGGSSGNRRVVLWQDSTRVPAEEIRRDRNTTVLPFRIGIPFSCAETDLAGGVRWRLTAEAEIPGVDLSVNFRLPMPRNEDSDPDLTEERLTAESEMDASMPAFGTSSGYVFSRKGDTGLRLTVAPVALRCPGMALGFGVFTFVWLGVGFGLMKIGAPIPIPIVMGVAGIVFLLVLCGWIFTRIRTRLTPDGLVVETKRAFGGSTQVLALDEIEGFSFEQGATSQSGDQTKTYYKVFAVPRGSDKKPTLASMVADKDQARGIVQLFTDQLERLTARA